MRKIFVTGALGYKGHIIVNKLLSDGFKVIAHDIGWFGNHLIPNHNLKVVFGDIRDTKNLNFEDADTIIHLASIANDPCGDLNPKLTWEVSCLSTMKLLEKASKSEHMKQFIYASSGSVYGLKDEDKVTEDLDLEPISEYNKTKMVAERVVLSYADRFQTQIIRPATVCGLSPRMRFDVAVNLLTIQAIKNKKITVLGGEQTRPNIHIDDIANVYLFFINNSQHTGVYNAGFENISILDIAKFIQKKLPEVGIEIKESNDPRSYRVDSSKLLDLGFKPSKNIDIAINEIIDKYNNDSLADEPINHNIKWMEKLIQEGKINF